MRKRLLEIRGLPDAWRRLLNGMSGRRVAIAPYRQDDCAAGVIVYAEGLLDSGLLTRRRTAPNQATKPLPIAWILLRRGSRSNFRRI